MTEFLPRSPFLRSFCRRPREREALSAPGVWCYQTRPMISCGWREGRSEASGGGELGHLVELLESSVPVEGYLPFHADLLLLLLCVYRDWLQTHPLFLTPNFSGILPSCIKTPFSINAQPAAASPKWRCLQVSCWLARGHQFQIL